MNKYEAMVMIKPDLSEEERKALFNQINDVVLKNKGQVTEANIWSERRKLYFPLKKNQEAVYYLVNFNALPLTIKDIKQAYNLNENILRVLITRV